MILKKKCQTISFFPNPKKNRKIKKKNIILELFSFVPTAFILYNTGFLDSFTIRFNNKIIIIIIIRFFTIPI